MQNLSNVFSNHTEDEWNLVCDAIDNSSEKLEKIKFFATEKSSNKGKVALSA